MPSTVAVLIESDWNLKTLPAKGYIGEGDVLIESDWNLKCHKNHLTAVLSCVLIESDWNLKRGFSSAVW